MLIKVDFNDNNNILIVALSIGLGLGVTVYPQIFQAFPQTVYRSRQLKRNFT